MIIGSGFHQNIISFAIFIVFVLINKNIIKISNKKYDVKLFCPTKVRTILFSNEYKIFIWKYTIELFSDKLLFYGNINLAYKFIKFPVSFEIRKLKVQYYIYMQEICGILI